MNGHGPRAQVRWTALAAALALASVAAAVTGAEIPAPGDRPYEATITLDDGSTIIGRVAKVDEAGRRLVIETWYKEVVVPLTQVSRVEPAPGAVFLADAKCPTILCIGPMSPQKAVELILRTYEYAGGPRKQGMTQLTVTGGIRQRGHFGVRGTIKGREGEYAFLIPEVHGEGPKEKRVFDPVTVRRVTRLKPGEEVKVHWRTYGEGKAAWIVAGEKGVIGGKHLDAEVSPALAAILKGLQGEQAEQILSLLEGERGREVPLKKLSGPAAEAAMLLLAEKLDTNRQAESAMEMLGVVLAHAEPGKVPLQVYDALVRGAFHPYNGVIARPCAGMLARSGYGDFCPILKEAADVRKGGGSGPAIAELAEELEDADRFLFRRPANAKGDGDALAKARKLAGSPDLALVTRGAEMLAKHGQHAEAINAHIKARNYWEAGQIAVEIEAYSPAADCFSDEVSLRTERPSDFSEQRIKECNRLIGELMVKMRHDNGWVRGPVEIISTDKKFVAVRPDLADAEHLMLKGLQVRFVAAAMSRAGIGEPSPEVKKALSRIRTGDNVMVHFSHKGRYRIDKIKKVEKGASGPPTGGQGGGHGGGGSPYGPARR